MHRASVTALKQAHDEKVSERFGKADKAMPAGTPICIAGYGRGNYAKWNKTLLGGNEHFVELEKGCFASEDRDGWVAGDVLPIKLKSETWTVYSAEFETVEALVSMNIKKGGKKSSKRGSKDKKKKGDKEEASNQLQDWQIGNEISSSVRLLGAKPKLNIVSTPQPICCGLRFPGRFFLTNRV
jgi:hypothetical protein